MSALLNPSLFHVKQKYTSHIFFYEIISHWIMSQGKRVSLGFLLWSQHWGMSITQAPAREGKIDAEDTCTAVLLLLLAELEWVWRVAGTGWTPNMTRTLQTVGVSPQCYICKYVVTNSSKDILCVIFHEHLLLHGDTKEEREVCNLICGIFHFPLPISVSGSSSCG